ncbi:LysR family transcriptional regulator [Xylophilus sp. Kf1]|nr:LysR family transcriptional regulator [Xylophilus sp. Kf1]
MNLRQLTYFCETAAAGSVARAARVLFVAPTAISMSISQLETELGGPLFDRAARPMPLTALGRFLLPRALELLGQAQRLENDAKQVATARQGWLGIGFTRSVMLSVLPPAVRQFRAAFPEVRLELVELLSEHQAHEITAGKVHLGISRFVDPVDPPAGFRSQKIFEEDFYAALPAETPTAGGPGESGMPITLAALARHPFVSYPRDPKTRYAAQILAAAARQGVSLDVQHEAMEIHTALGLVAAGLGATLVGASVALRARSDVSFHPVTGLAASTTVEALLPLHNANAFAVPFVDILRQAAAAHLGRVSQPVGTSPMRPAGIG